MDQSEETVAEAKPASKQGGAISRFVKLLRSNWISWLGVHLAALAVLGVMTAYVLEAQGIWGGPYLGIVVAVLLPVMFIAGIAMIPMGLVVYRRHLRKRVEALADKPMYLARAVVAITVLNFAGVGMVGYAGVEYMSSVQFCGTACHQVMEPEYVAYQFSPHANVECVACHVGPGADWFIKSKLNGVNQLIGVITDDYSRPIPTPVHNLRSASETCETCHWPEKHLGTKMIVRPHFMENAENTELTNVLLMRRGGTAPDGTVAGIHWHAHPDTVLEFVSTDPEGEAYSNKPFGVETSVPWMRVKHGDGEEKIFVAEGVDFDNPPEGVMRRMDCNDCHNRAAHEFVRAPEAVDEAMAYGLVSRELPFIKKHAVEALVQDWTRENVAEGIRRFLQDAYVKDGNLAAETMALLEPSIDELVKIWRRNVYPDRKLYWDSYRRLNNHFGCFRCHDGKHKDRQGTILTQDCEACHVVLSDSQRQPKVLEDLRVGGR